SLPRSPFSCAQSVRGSAHALHGAAWGSASGDEAGLGVANPLARHLVGHGIRGAALAARPLENLSQTGRDALNLARALSLGSAAAIFPRHADDPTRIDDIVRRIQDAGRLQSSAIALLR